jgi:TolB-like protein/DNA-binding winged helix-turn-helix (wHTH) protein/Flp pilus assembly protein TadD
MSTPDAEFESKIIRFGVFEVDLRAGELRRRGLKVPLQEKPFQTLAALLERDGAIVTREELRLRLWPTGTVIEFDANLNSAIRRLREALGDSAEQPRYVETLPRRGYRFLVPVQKAAVDEQSVRLAPTAPSPRNANSRRPYRRYAALGAALVAVAVLTILWHRDYGGHVPPRLLLAVLPFRNLSGQSNEEFVSDGLTEELSTQLGRLDPEHLGVIAHTSVMRYKDQVVDVRQVGRDLGVSYVVESSVRRDTEELFVTVQLIQVQDQTQRWAETYKRPRGDVFNVQRDISRHIAQALALNLLPGREEVLARAETTNSGAYDDYLRGRYSWSLGTEAGFREALSAYRAAITKDPVYAMAYAGIAQTDLSLADYHFVDPASGNAEAREAASKGLTLDNGIPELALLEAALLETEHSPTSRIAAAYRNAIGLDPNSAKAHLGYALFLREEKQLPQALVESRMALALDPASPNTCVSAGRVYFAAHDNAEAARLFKRALLLMPGYPSALYFLGLLAEQDGRHEEAIANYQLAVTSSGRTPKYLRALGVAFAKLGRMSEAQALLDELRKQSATRYVDPQYLTSIEALISSQPRQIRN